MSITGLQEYDIELDDKHFFYSDPDDSKKLEYASLNDLINSVVNRFCPIQCVGPSWGNKRLEARVKLNDAQNRPIDILKQMAGLGKDDNERR